MRFFTVAKLGPKQELTPEGFLLCRDVPIARIGTQIYAPHEVPIEPGPDGRITIERRREDVFHDDCLDSCIGKPIVDEHPAIKSDPNDWTVDPENWRDVTRGVCISARQGRGADDGIILADLLIQDAAAIDLVRKKIKTEVSCGYAARYEPSGTAGYGFQTHIIVNHIALVGNGRCGSRCSIGDSAPEEITTMSWFDRLKKALDSNDEKEAAAALAEAPNGAKLSLVTHDCARTHDHDGHAGPFEMKVWGDKELDDKFKAQDAKIDELKTEVKDGFKKIHDAMSEKDEDEKEAKTEDKKVKDNEIENELEEEAPAGTGDKARKAHDSAYLDDSFRNTVSLAEIITPGVAIPTFDAKAKPTASLLNLTKFRRHVLDKAYTNDYEIQQFIDEQVRDFSKVQTVDAVRSLFMSVGAFRKRANSQATSSAMTSDIGGFGVSVGRTTSPADLNKKNAEFWKGRI